MDMMSLLHAWGILRKTVHYFCQIAVHCHKDIHSDGEIGGEKECPFPFIAQSLDFGHCLGPSGRSAYHRHSLRE